jgi:hypothetical protein
MRDITLIRLEMHLPSGLMFQCHYHFSDSILYPSNEMLNLY